MNKLLDETFYSIKTYNLKRMQYSCVSNTVRFITNWLLM